MKLNLSQRSWHLFSPFLSFCLLPRPLLFWQIISLLCLPESLALAHSFLSGEGEVSVTLANLIEVFRVKSGSKGALLGWGQASAEGVLGLKTVRGGCVGGSLQGTDKYRK